MALGWYNTGKIGNRGWVCGYCGNNVGGSIGFHDDKSHDGTMSVERIYICPKCEKPTAFVIVDGCETQVPGAPYGVEVLHVPDDVRAVYSEARRCIQCTAYTSAVLALRKLLMHVAVDKGADGGMPFVKYVDYLEEFHYIPPDGREWADSLRRLGNEATHEIKVMGEADAKRLLDFAEMLLKIAYEFPARVHDNG